MFLVKLSEFWVEMGPDPTWAYFWPNPMRLFLTRRGKKWKIEILGGNFPDPDVADQTWPKHKKLTLRSAGLSWKKANPSFNFSEHLFCQILKRELFFIFCSSKMKINYTLFWGDFSKFSNLCVSKLAFYWLLHWAIILFCR